MTVCGKCPILNHDYEYGCSCNLGYNTYYKKVGVTPSGKDHYTYVSEDCGLLRIEVVVEKGRRKTIVNKQFNPKVSDVPY